MFETIVDEGCFHCGSAPVDNKNCVDICYVENLSEAQSNKRKWNKALSQFDFESRTDSIDEFCSNIIQAVFHDSALEGVLDPASL